MRDDCPKWAGDFDGVNTTNNPWSSHLKFSIKPYVMSPGMVQAVSDIRDSILSLQKNSPPVLISSSAFEAMSSLRSVYSETLTGVLADLSASLRRATFDISPVFQRISDSLKPLYEQLSTLDLKLDWQGLRRGYIGWGGFGWIIPREMSFSEMRSVPQSLEEADRACMRYYGKAELESLFDRMCDNSHKKKDLREAIALFNERRYKPCAMMLCALIEGELIKLGGRARGKDRRSGKRTIDMISDRAIEQGAFLAFAFENYSMVWNYFYKAGKDFSREREGELNRNFLLHGMMYKPVRKKTCVKLFCLLDATTDLLPTVAEL